MSWGDGGTTDTQALQEGLQARLLWEQSSDVGAETGISTASTSLARATHAGWRTLTEAAAHKKYDPICVFKMSHCQPTGHIPHNSMNRAVSTRAESKSPGRCSYQPGVQGSHVALGCFCPLIRVPSPESGAPSAESYCRSDKTRRSSQEQFTLHNKHDKSDRHLQKAYHSQG